MERIASVVLSEGLRSFDKSYDYKVPEKMSLMSKGMRVLVPFGSNDKLQVAWVIDVREDSAQFKLKEVSALIDDYPLLTEEMIKLAEWMKQRFFCTWGDAIRNMIPAGINLSRQRTVRIIKDIDDEALLNQYPDLIEKLGQSKEGILLQNLCNDKETLPDSQDILKLLNLLEFRGYITINESFEQRVSEKTQKAVYPVIDKSDFDALYEGGKIKSIYQIRMMEVLFQEGLCTLQDLMLIPGVTHQTIKTLYKKGWLEYTEIEAERNPFEVETIEKTEAPQLTKEQESVLKDILPLFDESRLSEVLLHGITGSGKTEVYLQLIDKVIKQGKTAIVLVPEISLTPQMTSRFTGRFGSRVAIQHSKLSLGERYDQWRKIKKGEVDVVIGARSAVFAPLTQIGIIIVDEEHELTYKSENTPKYDARHIARARCNMNGALLLLGSATPSIETYYRAKNGKIKLCEMSARANAKPLPEVYTVDMRKELEEGNRSIISRRLEDELVKNKEASEQSILFLNRRGYASFLLCADCGFVLKCPNCTVSLTYHAKDNQAICHYCGYTIVSQKRCPDCGGHHFKGFGIGTQRIEDELVNHTSHFSVLRMDLDTTGNKYGHKRLLDAFRNGEADILIGTQMVAKGHDFPNVTLVGILSADASLYTGDYRASERTFQLITQASGRSGRGDKSGRVILQAYNIEDYAIKTAIDQNYQAFFEQEILIRKQLFNPPFTHIGLIMVSSEDINTGFDGAEKIYQYLIDFFGSENGVMISKPMKAPVFILRNKARWRIIIKHPSVNHLIQMMHKVLDKAIKLRLKGCQVSVDIDPASML